MASTRLSSPIPDAYVDRVFDTMEQPGQHTYQLLTKRSSRMRTYVNRRYAGDPVPPHIWLGVSVEDGTKRSRIEHLRQTNAAVRFLSLEPLIGPMGHMNLDAID